MDLICSYNDLSSKAGNYNSNIVLQRAAESSVSLAAMIYLSLITKAFATEQTHNVPHRQACCFVVQAQPRIHCWLQRNSSSTSCSLGITVGQRRHGKGWIPLAGYLQQKARSIRKDFACASIMCQHAQENSIADHAMLMTEEALQTCCHADDSCSAFESDHKHCPNTWVKGRATRFCVSKKSHQKLSNEKSR